MRFGGGIENTKNVNSFYMFLQNSTVKVFNQRCQWVYFYSYIK